MDRNRINTVAFFAIALLFLAIFVPISSAQLIDDFESIKISKGNWTESQIGVKIGTTVSYGERENPYEGTGYAKIKSYYWSNTDDSLNRGMNISRTVSVSSAAKTLVFYMRHSTNINGPSKMGATIGGSLIKEITSTGSATESSWEKVEFNLTSLRGKSVTLTYFLYDEIESSGDRADRAGWIAIDNISIEEEPEEAFRIINITSDPIGVMVNSSGEINVTPFDLRINKTENKTLVFSKPWHKQVSVEVNFSTISPVNVTLQWDQRFNFTPLDAIAELDGRMYMNFNSTNYILICSNESNDRCWTYPPSQYLIEKENGTWTSVDIEIGEINRFGFVETVNGVTYRFLDQRRDPNGSLVYTFYIIENNLSVPNHWQYQYLSQSNEVLMKNDMFMRIYENGSTSIEFRTDRVGPFPVFSLSEWADDTIIGVGPYNYTYRDLGTEIIFTAATTKIPGTKTIVFEVAEPGLRRTVKAASEKAWAVYKSNPQAENAQKVLDSLVTEFPQLKKFVKSGKIELIPRSDVRAYITHTKNDWKSGADNMYVGYADFQSLASLRAAIAHEMQHAKDLTKGIALEQSYFEARAFVTGLKVHAQEVIRTKGEAMEISRAYETYRQTLDAIAKVESKFGIRHTYGLRAIVDEIFDSIKDLI